MQRVLYKTSETAYRKCKIEQSTILKQLGLVLNWYISTYISSYCKRRQKKLEEHIYGNDWWSFEDHWWSSSCRYGFILSQSMEQTQIFTLICFHNRNFLS